MKAKRPKSENKSQKEAASSPNTRPSKSSAPAAKKKDKGKQKAVESEEETDEDDNSDVENLYLSGRKAGTVKSTEEDAASPSSSDDEHSPLVHESLKTGKKKGRSLPAKFVPSDETADQRNARTIFIGNLPLQVAQKKVSIPHISLSIGIHNSFSLYLSSCSVIFSA